METYQLKSLLQQVSTLNAHYKKISEMSGENFNVFRILKLESSEVRMHSAFIAELLNPQGSHGQKDIFLKLFIKSFCFKGVLINTETCKVEIEKHTGFISEAGTEGGRIDIIVTDRSGHHIIIENKIYAGDQHNQLARYSNYSPFADLIYLTLDGRTPDEKSHGTLINDIHFICKSYKYDILTWLESCRKEVTVMPVIRESITQYINLIKYLTNQTINHNMENDLAHLISSNITSSFLISDNLYSGLNEAAKKYSTELDSICSYFGLRFSNEINFYSKYNGIFIWDEKWLHTVIGFHFQNYNKDLIYGFIADEDPKSVPANVRQKLNNFVTKNSKSSEWWPWYQKVDSPYDNWSRYDAWRAIEDGSMQAMMKEKIGFLLKIAEGIEL